MAHANIGKNFEVIVRESLSKVNDVDVQRLYDSQSGFYNIKQPADFIVYKYPYQYYLECKSTYKHTLHKDYITQLPSLIEKSEISGIIAGVIVWFIEDDITAFIKAKSLKLHFEAGHKSVNVKEIINNEIDNIKIDGEKKRVYWDYDFNTFFTRF